MRDLIDNILLCIRESLVAAHRSQDHWWPSVPTGKETPPNATIAEVMRNIPVSMHEYTGAETKSRMPVRLKQ